MCDTCKHSAGADAPAGIPNKFQSLIESPEVLPYTAQEREEKTINLTEEDFVSKVLPAIQSAAESHVKARRASVEEKQSMVRDTEHDCRHSVEAVVEALNDPHFRKQRNFGPSKEQLREKVYTALERNEPIELVALMFTRKNINPLKRGPGDESTIDLAELVSLIHLNSFASLITTFHPYGARFTILSEGMRFKQAFHLREEVVRTYQRRMRNWIYRLGLANLRFVDYEDFLDAALTSDQKVHRDRSYRIALDLYENEIGRHLHAEDMASTMQHAIAVDPVKDQWNARNNFVPLWDSIKHSIPYSFLESAAAQRGLSYEVFYKLMFGSLMHVHADADTENLRTRILRESWDAAIEHNARIKGDADAGIDVAVLIGPSTIRTTINPKPASQYLGIHAVRETVSRVQPWHGTPYLTLDGLGKVRTTILTKLEIESMGGIPMEARTDDGPICFYASPDAAIQVAKNEVPTFNMSTKH